MISWILMDPHCLHHVDFHSPLYWAYTGGMSQFAEYDVTTLIFLKDLLDSILGQTVIIDFIKETHCSLC